MKTNSERIIQEYDSLESGQLIVFLYRLKNLCLTADGSALLSAEIIYNDDEYNIEDVAQVSNPNERQFCIMPKDKAYIKPIVEAIFKVHPELKIEVKELTENGFEDPDPDNPNNDHLRVVLATIPPVDKNRYDVVKDAIEAFYQECKSTMEKHKTEYAQRLAVAIASLDPQIADERKKEFDETTDTYVENREKMKEAHLKAADEAYAEYEAEKAEKVAKDKEETDAKGKDSTTMSMNFFNQED